ncbi:hypothetical protein [Candidatus Methylocalor cossyra]|uniref:Uncharacterized protein n=1 Tax=Candidatus Methylocalor cossyra TaxID=3108543 RepID=A0ABM9NIE6_9GAMM
MPPAIPSAIPEPVTAWLALAGLGAYHGLNPGMGWLFAVALGLQRRDPRAVLLALPPIALGHAAAVGAIALVLAGGRFWLELSTLRLVTACTLLAFGFYKCFTYYRHPRWVGMRVGPRELVLWSALMGTAHGAGLMAAPFLVEAAWCGARHGTSGLPLGVALHSGAMFLSMATIAWLVYRRLDLGLLRRVWINLDLLWAVALLASGALALAQAL